MPSMGTTAAGARECRQRGIQVSRDGYQGRIFGHGKNSLFEAANGNRG